MAGRYCDSCAIGMGYTSDISSLFGAEERSWLKADLDERPWAFFLKIINGPTHPRPKPS